MVWSKLEALAVRPPTPPKDIAHAPALDVLPDADETLQFLQDPFGDHPALPRAVATARAAPDTPQPSPSSDISPPSSAASRQKRVNFQLQTCHGPPKAPALHTWTPTRSSPLRPLPQTRVSKPLKSILKPADATPTPPPQDQAAAAAHKFKTLPDMLESIVKQLASPDRPSRMDAYHSLNRTMQAYDKIPDEHALKQKMSLLTQFIRRDMLAPSPTSTGLDSQLIAQALKMLMTLFRIPEAMSAMDDDFCCFVVDRTIHVASDATMPKAIVNTHLATLMQQNFRHRIMTVGRVEKIMDFLDTITDRIGGFSVQAYRLRIYRKLMQQQPGLLVKHTERWFKHTAKALTAGQKDIYQSALDIAFSAAKTIGHDSNMARSCLAVLNRVKSNGETVAKVMAKELERMLSSDNAASVPQIWSAVTVLLRDALHSHMFAALKEWLGVFEKCLTSEKESVKVQTNAAFASLIYAVNIAQSTSESWTKMFSKVPLHQLQRRVPAKKAERDAVSSGYLTLLYYALQPAAPHVQLDRYWREFVASFWTPLVRSSSSPHAFAACRTVSALLSGSRKPWSEQRVLDQRTQGLIQQAELPLLDSKWVRKSILPILQFVEILLDVTPWSNSEQSEDEPIRSMWIALLNSLVEASSKEVMASSETKHAMAHIVNLLRRVWETHTAKLAVPQHKEDLWASKFCFLIETVVQKLGPFQFADKCLTRHGAQDFEVASTPSHRSKQQGPRTSPLLHFVDLLINQSEGKMSDAVRIRVLKLILEPCLRAQNTRLSKLELLRDCSVTADISPRTSVALDFRTTIANLLQSSLQCQSTDQNQRDARPLGREYETVAELFASGTSYFLNESRGHEMLSIFIDVVRKESGELAVVLAAIEKLSDCVVLRVPDETRSSCSAFTSILLRNLPHQTSRRGLEQARQQLWPSSQAVARHANFDPYDNLYTAVVSVGLAAYRDLNNYNVESAKDLLASLGASIKNCATSHLAVYLRKTQDVIGRWVQDPGQKMQGTDEPMKALHRKVLDLWREVSISIERLPRKDSQLLLHLESLITAGFISKRRSIVNISIATWNRTFGKEESLRYPSLLEPALRRLRSVVDLSLPSLENSTEDTVEAPSFYDSDVSDHEEQAVRSIRAKASSFKVIKTTRGSVIQSPVVSTPGSKRRSAQRTPKVRLRHDNSQIKFEPVISSPSNPFEQESQVLTERQKEMVERQRLTGGLFANMAATVPQQNVAPSPLEIHSDALTVEDSPIRESRKTPLKTVAVMDPMDIYCGSSPTPHARRSTRNLNSDESSFNTPTVGRTNTRLAEVFELGSSPPRFEEAAISTSEDSHTNLHLKNNTEAPGSESFDMFGSVDNEVLTNNDGDVEGEQCTKIDVDTDNDTIMSELPSSTLDLQLTAQIDADIQAHMAVSTENANQEQPKTHHNGAMTASEVQDRSIDTTSQDVTDMEISDSQTSSGAANQAQQNHKIEPTSTSCIDDSFSNAASSLGSPRSHSLRRSARRSATQSPSQILVKKSRKQTPSKGEDKTMPRKSLRAMGKATPELPMGGHGSDVPNEDGMLDNIVVSLPITTLRSSKKRKSMDAPESSPESRNSVPEPMRKRGPVRRSQSLLSHVKSSQDVVEDTPAPKRARQSEQQDVSEAKRSCSNTQPSSQTKRLSHVQVTPRRSPVSARHDTAAQVAGESQSWAVVATPSRSFTERVMLTPRSIVNQLLSLKDMLFSAPQLVVGREDERAIDDALFHIRRQVLAAGLRNEGQTDEQT